MIAGETLPPLEPVPAAQAAIAAMARSQPTASTVPARRRPVIAPAEPDRWSTTVTLAYPLLVDGERVDRVIVRRITGGEVARLIMEDDAEVSLNLRCRALMCGLDPEVIEALAADDAEAVAVSCRPFLPGLVAGIEAGLADAVDDPDL